MERRCYLSRMSYLTLVVCVGLLCGYRNAAQITDALEDLAIGDPRPLWRPPLGHTGPPFPEESEITLVAGEEKGYPLKYQTRNVRIRGSNDRVGVARLSDDEDSVWITGVSEGATSIEETGNVLTLMAGGPNVPPIQGRRFSVRVAVRVSPSPERARSGQTAPFQTPSSGSGVGDTNSRTDTLTEVDLDRVRRAMAQLRAATPESIEPLSMSEIARRTAKYRRSVDRTVRQPFLMGATPDAELLTQANKWQARWGNLGAAVRSGDPRLLGEPPKISPGTLSQISPESRTSGDAPVRVVGWTWAAISDDYFKGTVEFEQMANREAVKKRESPKLQELIRLMREAEERLESARKSTLDPNEEWRREQTRRLHAIWKLGIELYESRLTSPDRASPDRQTLEAFLRASDSWRGIRENGQPKLSAKAQPTPVAPEVVRAPAGRGLGALLAPSEGAATVAPPPPNRLPQLAADLYRAHYHLQNAERMIAANQVNETEIGGALGEPPKDSTRESMKQEFIMKWIETSKQQSETRRTTLLSDITSEFDRVFGPGR